MTCQELHGARARYVWLEGQLECQDKNGTLTLRSDDGCIVMNLRPDHVQVITLLEDMDPCHS